MEAKEVSGNGQREGESYRDQGEDESERSGVK